MPDYDYPFVECQEHLGPQKMSLVCDHVLAHFGLGEGPSAPMSEFDAASDEEPGFALCAACCALPEETIGRALRTVCEQHFFEMLGGGFED